jgi:hypothetical protein
MLVTTSSKLDSQDVDYIEESNVTGTITGENIPKNEGTPHENYQEVLIGEDIEMAPLDDMDKKEGGGI